MDTITAEPTLITHDSKNVSGSETMPLVSTSSMVSLAGFCEKGEEQA